MSVPDVRAWASAHELVFGQLACQARRTEITATPTLPALPDLIGAAAPIDAEGCQEAIATHITDQRGAVTLVLDEASATEFEGIAYESHDRVDGGHGRVETRRDRVTPEVGWFEDRHQWAGCKALPS